MNDMTHIFQRHGVLCMNAAKKGQEVILRERVDGTVSIDSCFDERFLTPIQARYLARRLYQLARRAEARAAK